MSQTVSSVQPPAQAAAPLLFQIIDLEMLVMPGGKERTAAEFEQLFTQAGFELTKIVPTGSPLSVIEARPV